jgi:hypothetical protein
LRRDRERGSRGCRGRFVVAGVFKSVGMIEDRGLITDLMRIGEFEADDMPEE